MCWVLLEVTVGDKRRREHAGESQHERVPYICMMSGVCSIHCRFPQPLCSSSERASRRKDK